MNAKNVSFNNDNRNIFVSPPHETGRGIAYIYHHGIHEHVRNGGQGQVCRLSYRDFLLDMKSILVQVNGQD